MSDIDRHLDHLKTALPAARRGGTTACVIRADARRGLKAELRNDSRALVIGGGREYSDWMAVLSADEMPTPYALHNVMQAVGSTEWAIEHHMTELLERWERLVSPIDGDSERAHGCEHDGLKRAIRELRSALGRAEDDE
jgi:hypothetical protein